MPDSRWTRRRKKRDDADPGASADENVDLAGAEHAWWAGRETLDSQDAPRGRKKRPVEEPVKKSAFKEYYSTESLFAPQPELLDPEDPYAVLGVPASATWEEITSAHRTLAKRFHPDRLTNMGAEERARGEVRIRDLNIAYMELRRRRGK
jgi:DnaJ-domain-containing protein 1